MCVRLKGIHTIHTDTRPAVATTRSEDFLNMFTFKHCVVCCVMAIHGMRQREHVCDGCQCICVKLKTSGDVVV